MSPCQAPKHLFCVAMEQRDAWLKKGCRESQIAKATQRFSQAQCSSGARPHERNGVADNLLRAWSEYAGCDCSSEPRHDFARSVF